MNKKTIAFELDEELLNKLKELAKKEERSLSAMIRVAIKELLMNRGL